MKGWAWVEEPVQPGEAEHQVVQSQDGDGANGKIELGGKETPGEVSPPREGNASIVDASTAASEATADRASSSYGESGQGMELDDQHM